MPSTTPSTSSSTALTTTSSAPALPDRPSTLSSTAGSDAYGTSAYNSPYRSTVGGLGSTYGGMGSTYGTSYGSPYSRYGGMGTMGGMGYGGYGGYGSYGGYGGGGYGGGYGMGMGMGMGMGIGGMPGMPGQPGDVSLTQRMEAGTQATFELISSIVGAFGGFAQMLESTFMATHSSFFAMVGVADQFAHLRTYLGQVLSIFALARYLKNLGLRLVGKAPPVELDAHEFKGFAAHGPSGQAGKAARPSKRPLIVFFMAVIGLPYLMGKLVRFITAKQEAERQRLEQQGRNPGQAGMLPGQHGGGMISANENDQAIDPSKLTFVRALYAYPAADPLELSLQPNDIVAVLSKHDPQTGAESAWWRGRTRDGRIGWFPSTYVESLESAKERAAKAASAGTATGGKKTAEATTAEKTAAKPATVKAR
ncbi:related to peroxisomal membrane protein pex13 [Ustilago sp. UG-2017a]|nr:related to peroxisomal membrane protein pex13 [Ustilago sp. UG-2017a]